MRRHRGHRNDAEYGSDGSVQTLQISDGDHHGSVVMSASLAPTETPAPADGYAFVAEGCRNPDSAPDLGKSEFVHPSGRIRLSTFAS